MNQFKRGSEWRKWDLHVHTKDTSKNDNFTSPNFDEFCITFFRKAIEKNIQAIGITDYFSIDNYKKVKSFVDQIDSKSDFDEQERDKIKDIFLLPNVELRMLPATDKGVLINIHFLFNPDCNFLETLDNDFFGSLEDSVGNKMNPSGIKKLGKARDSNLDDEAAYKKGVEVFHVGLSDLIELKEKAGIKENTIIVVSNSSFDGASSLQEHYKLFENEPGSLDEVRSNIYTLSDAIFSGNPRDREFFLGKKSGHDESKIINDCGSLKPCVHGSDAHDETELFNPDKGRFCWIKADPTFEGLKQIIYEPEERVYIGTVPPTLSQVESNRTKYIKCLKINQTDSNHDGDIWFKDIKIYFNKELVAIIGNKGSGKSGIADILGLVGDTNIDNKYFSFLHKNKFLKEKLADKFKAEIIWESDGNSDEVPLGCVDKNNKPESVRFIPQNYFEDLTNEIEISKFQRVLENIIFEYIPVAERHGLSAFEALKEYRTSTVSSAIKGKQSAVHNINEEIIKLEEKKNPDYLKFIKENIIHIRNEISEQEKLLNELPEIPLPDEQKASSQENDKIKKINKEIESLEIEKAEKEKEKSKAITTLEGLRQFKERVKQQHEYVKRFINDNNDEAIDFGLEISEILDIKVDYGAIEAKITHYVEKLEAVNEYLESSEAIKENKTEQNNKSIIYKLDLLFKQLATVTDKLTEEEQKYQQIAQKKKTINDQIFKLKGDPENPQSETLAFYKKELSFVNDDLDEIIRHKRIDRISITVDIFKSKSEIINLYNSFKGAVDTKIRENKDLLEDYDIKIDASFNLDAKFYKRFLDNINQRKKGYFSGTEEGKNKIIEIVEDEGFESAEKISSMLEKIIESLETDNQQISDQVKEDNIVQFYDYLFSLDFVLPKYELKLADKTINLLSPGERGALLLIFYLMIDNEKVPLIIDQPEDNLDNESVFNMLSKFIKQAKKKRQIFMVTHNPNLAVCADADQVIHVNIDKLNKNKFTFRSGSIENPAINGKIVQILEGTRPAFDKRKLKYQ